MIGSKHRFYIKYRYNAKDPWTRMETDSERKATRPIKGVREWVARERYYIPPNFNHHHTRVKLAGQIRTCKFYEYSRIPHVLEGTYVVTRIFHGRKKAGQLYVVTGASAGRRDYRVIRETRSIREAMSFGGRRHRVWIDYDNDRSTQKGRKLIKAIDLEMKDILLVEE